MSTPCPRWPREATGVRAHCGTAVLASLLAVAAAAHGADAPAIPALSTDAPAAPAAQAPAGTLAELLTLLARRRHREADFQEVKYVAVLDQPLQSSGVLIYDAPDHLEQRIEHPRAETAVLDHGVLTLRIGRRERSLSLSDSPQLAPLIDSMRALLAGDQPALEALFTVRLSGPLASWQLQLEPREARLRASVRQIEVRGEYDRPRAVELYQSNGDHSIMRIQPRP